MLMHPEIAVAIYIACIIGINLFVVAFVTIGDWHGLN